ncbi:MAG TPA: SIMPL domain-containing protein [Phycisphaerales bacterium]|nr:SIMPL domain-containing protein [Phycisphaerales bacterium]
MKTMNRRVATILMVVSGACGVVAFTPAVVCAEAAAGAPSPFTQLIVRGWHELEVDPDFARIQLAIESTSESADAALSQTNEIAERVVADIKKTGIDAKQITLRWPGVTPIYEGEEANPFPRQRTKIIGYRGGITVQVELNDLGRATEVVRTGLRAGAVGLRGLWFEIKNSKRAKDEAITGAVTEARQRGESLAAAANLVIHGISRLNLDDASISTTNMFDSWTAGGGVVQNYEPIEAKLLALTPQPVTVTASVTIEFNTSPK